MKNCKTCGKEIKCRTQCSACRQRKWRKNNPFKYAWKNKRHDARQRGIPFTITLEQFKELWKSHPEQWESKERPNVRSEYDLHRKDNDKGYHIDNVEIVKHDDHMQLHKDEKELITTKAPF